MANVTRNRKISRAMMLAWREGNQKFFNGNLPRPRFRVRDLSAHGAMALWESNYQGNGETISVDPKYVHSGIGLIRNVLHEMIHQLQWQQRSERTQREQHGRFFQRHHIRIFGRPYK